MTDKVKPDPEDYAQVEREYGPLPWNATTEEQGERYRLAQSAKLIGLYRQGKLPPELAGELRRNEKEMSKSQNRPN
jgi:hypothetical protein